MNRCGAKNQEKDIGRDSGLDHPESAILLQKGALDYAGVSLKNAKTEYVGNGEGGLSGVSSA